MTYHIGQVHAPAVARQIVTGPEMPPVWHCLKVRGGTEQRTRDFLKARDIFAFFPSYTRTFHRHGKTFERERAHIPGQVYAQFRQQVQWDVIKARGIASGVYCIGNRPVAIPRDVIRHLQGLTVDAERLRAAQEELLRIRQGDTAEIVEGPLAGFAVSVVGIADGEALFEFLTGGRGRASLASLRRKI